MHSHPLRRSTSWLAALTLALSFASSSAASAQAAAGPDRTPQRAALERIQKTREDLSDWLTSLDPERELTKQGKQRLRENVRVLTDALEWVPSEIIPIAENLLDLASYQITRLPHSSYFIGGGTKYYVRRVGLNALKLVQANGHRRELADWMTRGVLAERKLNDDSRRWFALYFLLSGEPPLLDRILVRIARDADDALGNEVLELLPSRSGPTIDEYLVERLAMPRVIGTPHPYNLLRERLQNGPLDSTAASHLILHVKGLLLANDWRIASRGIELCRDMKPERATPMLIEALFTWKKRGELGVANARRMTWDIVGVLQSRSGRSIGATPQNWMTWWNAVRDGLAEFADGEPSDDVAQGSTAEFFGLHPKSDRLTFIIDHSTSMSWRWSNSNSTRYEQAIDQLLNFLQTSGELTEFNIILFDSSPLTSTPHLIPASVRNLERARKSLSSRSPSGSTFLRGAVETALKLDRYGTVDPAKVEIDTIVVLCDGQTDSGSGWVRPLLERVNEDLRVVFHCVQIGSEGDGTLEELARLSGGEFVRIPE